MSLQERKGISAASAKTAVFNDTLEELAWGM